MGRERSIVRKGRTTSKKSPLRKVEREQDGVHGGGKVILLGVAKKPESKMTTFEKIDLVDHGIPKKDLERLKEVADLDYDQLAKVLSVTRATLINKKGEDRFNTTLSEKILSLADIYSYGYEVFEDDQRFNEWIFHPNKALGGQAPYDLLDTQFGREEIKNLIGRIDYGVYS
ncbi:DUF2384 domain-containing protein [Chitinophagaceae bacterium LB-8]|jgi:putative toxin-antitoxin system antitoxin component (TIGR02293 family)|uniref:DUF2384 domain-containing protein n=1 Tax=Paraflavisolibacter caeni TaxID=2982496 RepID=A0A9X2XU70_9BACT|nr:antitoxin Xre/MbcA/ParS toxin-binding domain-containing protein [Paraflavisolibacter caeni]MCU7548551.1 DUF2384 domain-containing protein [Paraflavisolibacter caeni]